MLISSSQNTENCSGATAKILMIHGHGQSGSFFYHKTRLLRKAIQDAMSPFSNVEFVYPNGPIPFCDRNGQTVYVWGGGNMETVELDGLETTIPHIINILEQHGPFTGIVGFSFGSAVATIITSLLEGNRPTFMSLPKITHPPLSFIINYSGLKFHTPRYKSLTSPRLTTPALTFIGELDTVVAGYLTQQLAEQYEISLIKRFFGTHYVPQDMENMYAVKGFIRSVFYQLSLLDGDGEWYDI